MDSHISQRADRLQQTRKALKLMDLPVSYRLIAERIGRSASVVCDVLNNRAWQHVNHSELLDLIEQDFRELVTKPDERK